eukprot:CAMPEP_0196591854 /NCGR_PEP_ID=MMETSP1081-20130531/71106_1 /TAXON_ID=36882 /ORGANISM="Pyramimonas amylifera, Strain CCMP720" /LENGTH=82 /DNA_ID=CAMNT_0041915365 /DNA_START=460 /DNA_END=705 /DNA_ORIENTATION=-
MSGRQTLGKLRGAKSPPHFEILMRAQTVPARLPMSGIFFAIFRHSSEGRQSAEELTWSIASDSTVTKGPSSRAQTAAKGEER